MRYLMFFIYFSSIITLVMRIYHVLLLLLLAVSHSILFAQIMAKKPDHQLLAEITSIDSDDFYDLKFLDTLVLNKRVVFLGESSHYVADFNTLKYRLIRYLHQHHGFEVVAFESGVNDCGWANLMKDSLTDIEMLAGSVKGIWRVRENLALMNYIRSNRLELAGVDATGTGYFDIYQKKLLQTLKDPSSFRELFKIDSVYNREYAGPKFLGVRTPKLDSIATVLRNQYNNIDYKLADKANDERNMLLRKAIQVRLRALQSLDNEDITRSGHEFREMQMAGNLQFLLDTLYRGKKIIVWAHNGHISKVGRGSTKAMSIPKYLPQSLKDQSYVLGLNAVNGEFAPNRRGEAQPIKLKNKAFEKVYEGFDTKGIFIPATQIRDKKYYSEILTYYKRQERGRVREFYDGVILLKDVKATKILYPKDL